MRKSYAQLATEYRQKYNQTLMCHTPKAIKAGAPADRIFAVTWVEDTEGLPNGKKLPCSPVLVAWKCTLLPNGKLDHPAYKHPLDPKNRSLYVLRGRNGSEPTAVFKPDSFYKPWSGDVSVEQEKAARALAKRKEADSIMRDIKAQLYRMQTSLTKLRQVKQILENINV